MTMIMIYDSSLEVMGGKKQLFFWISAGRKIAIDASMCIYQFLIAVRQDGNVLQNEDGETTRYVHINNCQNVIAGSVGWNPG